MSDLVLREKDGWIEITRLVEGLAADLQDELWEYLGRGSTEDAVDHLEIALGDELQDLIGQAEIKDVTGFVYPDTKLGELFRVWVKIQKG